MAAFSCVARSASATARLTEAMPAACVALASEIPATSCVTRSIDCTISPMVAPARLTCCTPLATRADESSIKPLISRAAWALRWASDRTSPATTAKPLPCGPARAASTAAFKASTLVWNARLSTSPTISAMRCAPLAMSRMLATTCATAVPPWRASSVAPAACRLAWSACSAVARTVPASSAMLAAASCSAPAWRAVRPDISTPPAAISPEPVWISSTPWRTDSTARVSPPCMRRIAEYSTPISLSPRAAIAAVRSPSAMRSKWRPASVKGRSIARRKPSRITTARTATSASKAAAPSTMRSSTRAASATAARPCSLA